MKNKMKTYRTLSIGNLIAMIWLWGFALYFTLTSQIELSCCACLALLLSSFACSISTKRWKTLMARFNASTEE